MGQLARKEADERVVEVDRMELVAKLTENRDKHVKEFEEAKGVYVSQCKDKLEKSKSKALTQLENNYNGLIAKYDSPDFDLEDQTDSFYLFEPAIVTMKVPRSYEAEYNVAIQMATADVRETLELGMAEFGCFWCDEWVWKSEFLGMTKMYSAKM